MSGAPRPQLVIFVKEPVPGRVKTRLGRSLQRRAGMVSAARWFRVQSLRLIRTLAADPRWETAIAVAPDVAGMQSRVWPAGVRRVPQGGGDLGARMGRIFAAAPPGPVLIIGADIPGITRRHVWSGLRALGQADAVLGPAADGGYWAIGLKRAPRRRPPELFNGVRWSTPQARADTIASLGRARTAMLETLRDVDTADDLPGAIP